MNVEIRYRNIIVRYKSNYLFYKSITLHAGLAVSGLFTQLAAVLI